MALTVSVMLIAALASAQTLDEIQVYTVAGVPASPYVNQTVTVTGTVYVQGGTYNSGTHYITDGTDGLQFFLNGSGLVIGDQVEITGQLINYSGELEINVPSVTLLGHVAEPVPTPITLANLLSDYENVGKFASTIGTVASVTPSVPGVSNGQFIIYEGTDSLLVFVDKDTMIDMGQVQVGDTYLVASPVVNYNTLIEFKPRRQSDLVENPGGDTVPVIATVGSQDWVQMANEAFTVTAQISDDLGIAAATLYYRDNNRDGTAPGAWMSTPMTGSGTYTGTVPAPHASDLIEFYVQATDTGAQTVTNPGSAPTTYYTAAVGLTSIYKMQYVHPDSMDQTNALNGKYLNIQGIVTAAPGEAGAVSRMVVQEQNPSSTITPITGDYAGTYGYGGVLVYAGAGLDPANWFRGDLVQVGGRASEYFGLTEFLPHNNTALYLVDFGMDLPPATRVQTRVLDDDRTSSDGNGALGEAWENVWVKTFTAAVIDTAGSAAYGEFLIADKDSRADSLIVAPAAVLAYAPNLGDVLTVEGFMDYAYGTFRLVPIADEFIVMSDATDVEVPMVAAGGFKSIAPNPFNPAAKISFVVGQDNLVQLNVYNLRGEKVRTLIQDRLPANEYTFTFDGKDDAGHALASGTYFARLRIGTDVMQVRKMSLVK
ncbi:MAG TPA: FlgD immunoglobulin-like domain containing protein [Candidatus Krumholzibacteria bacterium]|nr:FlgD immunoglobulin-like domain containing protein [Candidatus Krumholzibacteria bacterium]